MEQRKKLELQNKSRKEVKACRQHFNLITRRKNMRTHEVKYDDISIKVTGPDDLIRKADELFFNYLSNKTKNVEINKPKTEFDEKLTAEPISDRHHLIDWKKYTEDIKNGKKIQVDNSAFTKLTNGEIVEFVITDVTDNYVRFETRNFIGGEVEWNEYGTNNGGYPDSDIRGYIDSTIWGLLPEDLQAVISDVDREWKDKDGNCGTYITKLFLPAASEVFDEDNCYGDKGLYKQLDYYKDARNRIRVNEDRYTRAYWLASVVSGLSMDACRVNNDGYANYWHAYSLSRVPVCFIIFKN